MAIPRNLANIAPHANASSTEFVINDGSADLDFRVESDGNANMLFVDAGNNRVGIGTGSPGVQLDVKGTSTTGQIRFAGSGSIVNRLYGDDDGIVILSADVNNAAAGSYMAFQVDGTERAQINASGNVQLSGNLGLGGTTPTTSGTGITFPATQSASSNANTLDDYEEGTFTPAYNQPGGFTISYTSRTGRYVKIGKLVYVYFHIDVASVSGTNASDIIVEGFPFACVNATDANAGAYVHYVAGWSTNFPSSFRFSVNATTGTFFYKSNVNGAVSGVACNNITAGAIAQFNLCYETN